MVKKAVLCISDRATMLYKIFKNSSAEFFHLRITFFDHNCTYVEFGFYLEAKAEHFVAAIKLFSPDLSLLCFSPSHTASHRFFYGKSLLFYFHEWLIQSSN